MKGISATIATVLLLLIVAASMIMAYSLFQSTGEKTAENIEAEQDVFLTQSTSVSIENANSDQLYVRNIGNPVPNYTLILYVDGDKVDIDAVDLEPGKVTAINLSGGFLAAGTYDFKLSMVNSKAAGRITVQKLNIITEPSFGSTIHEPISIFLVLDKSTSMLGEKLAAAKVAAVSFVDIADDTDEMGLVSFSTSASLDQQLTIDKQAVKNKINALIANGWTAIGDGIYRATGELVVYGMDRKIEVLLTDGKETRNSNPEGRAAEAAAQNITIYAIGLGSDVDETQLRLIANMTGGSYYFSPSSQDLMGIFTQIAVQLQEGWVDVGAADISNYGSSCYSPEMCAKFSGGVYPNTMLLQNRKITFPGSYNIDATARAYVTGNMCSSCAQLPGETCRDNDARIHLMAYDAYDQKIGETVGDWAGAQGTGWISLSESWQTPSNTKSVTFQVDAGDCCTCNADLYVDDAYMSISK